MRLRKSSTQRQKRKTKPAKTVQSSRHGKCPAREAHHSPEASRTASEMAKFGHRQAGRHEQSAGSKSVRATTTTKTKGSFIWRRSFCRSPTLLCVIKIAPSRSSSGTRLGTSGAARAPFPIRRVIFLVEIQSSSSAHYLQIKNLYSGKAKIYMVDYYYPSDLQMGVGK